jgi:uncharacterized membrane protein required for colicin V production
MLMDFFIGLNWIDILMAVIFARIVYIGVKKGFVVEFFKFWGVLFSVFLTLHYYSVLADWLATQVSFAGPKEIRIFVFLCIWLFLTFVFKLVREGLTALFTVQPHPLLEKWGGGCLAVLRGMLICSLTFFALLLSLNPDVLKLSEKSWSKYTVGSLASHIYFSTYWAAVIKFFPAEPVNQEALAVPRLIERKKK